jgi:acetyl-CoA carboxylase carboxyltransferase component
MNEFVTPCGRDRVPIIWLQDSTEIDMSDINEKAQLLGLGQSLIYSIQHTDVPQMLIVLRKGTAAAHYVMGGPTANRHNAFTLTTTLNPKPKGGEPCLIAFTRSLNSLEQAPTVLRKQLKTP